MSDKPFKCEICDKRFPLRVALKRHLKIHTEESALNFKCDLCEKKLQEEKLFENTP